MEIVINALTVALGCGIFYYGNQHATTALKKIRRAYRNRVEQRHFNRRLKEIEARKARRQANAKAAAAEELTRPEVKAICDGLLAAPAGNPATRNKRARLQAELRKLVASKAVREVLYAGTAG